MQLKSMVPPQNGSAHGQNTRCKASRKGTGPRTSIGKDRSKFNAMKHGLFAQVLLLRHEPRRKFEILLDGLREDIKPEGMLQEILVEKIATTLWRQRRFFQVEREEVLKNVHEVWMEKRRHSNAVQCAMEEVTRKDRRGMIQDIWDLDTTDQCLSKLSIVKENAERFGLDCQSHSDKLGIVYGARYPGRPGRDLFDIFLECVREFKAPAAERAKKGFASEEDCLQKFISETKKEILRLERRRKHMKQPPGWQVRTEDEKPKPHELLKCAIPDAKDLDRLMSYETRLERSFERLLNQLERLQRSRDERRTLDIVPENTSLRE